MGNIVEYILYPAGLCECVFLCSREPYLQIRTAADIALGGATPYTSAR